MPKVSAKLLICAGVLICISGMKMPELGYLLNVSAKSSPVEFMILESGTRYTFSVASNDSTISVGVTSSPRIRRINSGMFSNVRGNGCAVTWLDVDCCGVGLRVPVVCASTEVVVTGVLDAA